MAYVIMGIIWKCLMKRVLVKATDIRSAFFIEKNNLVSVKNVENKIMMKIAIGNALLREICVGAW